MVMVASGEPGAAVGCCADTGPDRSAATPTRENQRISRIIVSYSLMKPRFFPPTAFLLRVQGGMKGKFVIRTCQLLSIGAALVALILVTPVPGSAQTTGSLPQLAAGQSLGIALGIPTVPTLRDVGGYKTRYGATVARGLAYRSDTFN